MTNFTMETLTSISVFLLNSNEHDKVEKLASLLKEIGSPIPVFDKLAIYQDDGGFAHPYYQMLIDEGCEFAVVTLGDEEYINLEHTAPFLTSSFNEKQASVVPYDPEVFKNVLFNSRLGNYLTKHFTQWVLTLDDQQLARFMHCFAEVPEDVTFKYDKGLKMYIGGDNNSGVIIDFHKMTLQARNEYVFRKQYSIDGFSYDTKGLLVYIALLAMEDLGNINALMNSIPNTTHRDPGYGVQALDEFEPDKDISMIMMNNSVLGLHFEQGGLMFPWVQLINTKIKEESIDAFATRGEAYITDKYYMKDIGGAISANAAGVGRNTEFEVFVDGQSYKIDVVLNNNRSDKLNKLLNGPNQFYRFLKAKVEGWQQMSWGNILPDGTVVRQGGVPLRTAIVETALNPGSGPSFIRPGLEFNVLVRKSAGEGSINFLSLPRAVRNAMNEEGIKQGHTDKPGLHYLKQMIYEKCEAIVTACNLGKVYKPGEVILSYGSEFNLQERIVCMNNEMNQNLKIVDFQVSENPNRENGYTPDYFKIKFIADMHFVDPMVKMRNAYIKLTTLPYSVKWFDENLQEIPDWGGVDITLNPETTKSPSIFQAMFIQEMGGGYYDANSGRVYLNKWDDAIQFFTDEEKSRFSELGEDMYIDTTARVEATVDEKGAVVITNDKETTRQLPQVHAIHNWAKSKKEARLMQMRVEKSYWDYAKQIVDPERIHSVEEKDTHYVVTEKVNVLISDYHYEVEISTPRENGGRSALTLQQLCHMTVADKELGEAINAESVKRRQSTKDLVLMMSKDVEFIQLESAMTTLELDEAGRTKLATLLGDALEENDRKLFTALRNCLCPKNKLGQPILSKEKMLVLIVKHNRASGTRTIVLPVKMSVLLENVGFLSGFADGVGKIFSTFIRYACSCNGESGVDSTFGSLAEAVRSSFDSWFDTLRESKSIYKRLSMTAKVGVNLKIRTSYHQSLHSTDGVPIVILHPDCDVTKELMKDAEGNYKPQYLAYPYCDLTDRSKCEADPEFFRGNAEHPYPVVDRLEGEFACLMRVPMPMGAAFRIKLSRINGYIAHAVVLPHLWAFLDEGDSDGDGVFMMNLSVYNFTTERALKFNDSYLSLKGYSLVYGLDPKQHPFADFCEVPGKKKIDYCWNNYFWPEDKYRQVCKDVRNHYIGPVGASYGVSSMLVFDLVNKMYSGTKDNVINKYEAATVCAWRMLYEGLGLAGWSADASKFFTILRAAAFAKAHLPGNNLVGYSEDGRITAFGYVKDDEDKKPFDPIDPLIELSGLNYQNPDKTEEEIHAIKRVIMKKVVEAMSYYIGFNALTRGNPYAKTVMKDKTFFIKSVVYGALRQATQGTDPVEVKEFEDVDDLSMSLHETVIKEQLYHYIQCPWLQTLLIDASKTLNILKQLNHQRMNEMF